MEDRVIDGRLTILANQKLEERRYWLRQLEGDWTKTHFPYDDEEKPGSTGSMVFKLTDETFAAIMRMSGGNDYAVHALCTAGLTALAAKYSRNSDILLGTPLYKQYDDRDAVNKVLVLRNRLHFDMTFKELLLNVKATIDAAVEHRDYPVEVLAEQVNRPVTSKGPFPLFDISIVLENIQTKSFLQFPYLSHSMVFTLSKKEKAVEGNVRYDSSLYRESTVEGIVSHFTRFMENALSDVNIPLNRIEILSPEEKKQLIYEFNDTDVPYPGDKTLHRMFEEQVEKTPDRIAVSVPIDLSDIHDRLESGAPVRDIMDKIETCCFTRNPYIYRYRLDLPLRDGSLYIFKTHRHNSVIINQNTAAFLDRFDGRRNLKDIFSSLHNEDAGESKNREVRFLVRSMSRNDLLEVTYQFDREAEEFQLSFDGSAEALDKTVSLVRTLYRNHLIDLSGIRTGAPVHGDKDVVPGFFQSDKTTAEEIPLENILRGKKLSKAPVLLLGDTPGIPGTGLLYLASYLTRNGIKTYCRFYDESSDYASMRESLETLLDRVRPTVVGISMKWFLFIARVIDMCIIIKEFAAQKNLEIKIVVGGNTASYYWEELISNDSIDYIVRGDGEEPFLRICRGNDIAGIPNCVYKKGGQVFSNGLSYIQDESHSPDVYLSHLDEILISDHSSRFGTFFIYTHKGCTMNCFYCGGCRDAQKRTFNRQGVVRRRVDEVRNDLIQAAPYASTFQFDFDIPDKNLVHYCEQIWEGIDLSNHFCVFATLSPPSTELIELVSKTFKYVYWDFDITTLSERHREQLVSLGMVKPMPSDKEILTFMERCEEYHNIQVRLNLINGLPYFTPEDIEPGKKLLDRIINTYSCFGELHWARLHAQPGAPILENAAQYNMHSYASSFDDFLTVSRKNFNRDTGYPGVENFDYPYIYYNDEKLNSRVTQLYLENNREVEHHTTAKRREFAVSDISTYRQLNEKADSVAGVLRAAGVQSGDIVAVMLDRSPEIPTAVLAVLKTGAAYMPIDPEFPAGRIDYMLADSSAAALITTRRLKTVSRKISTIFIDDTEKTDLQPVPVSHQPESLCYVIYTSGTTGKPKGVMLQHRNLVNYVHWFTTAAGITAEDRTVLTSSFAFDLGYTSLYTSILNGGELHILPRDIYLLGERLLHYIKRNAVTYIKVTPSLFSVIVHASNFSPETCRSLRVAVIGGEAINVDDIDTAHTLCPHLRVMNHYGPTEAAVGCIAVFVDFQRFEEYRKHPVIGKPIHNTRIFILGTDSNVQPAGVPGELCISGSGLARGYLNRPQLTAEKFSCFYKTGDLARWLPDGHIEFLGRIDSQVKVRGYRIELGEIEARLRNHSKIDEALVIVKEPAESQEFPGREGSDKYLCAYIVPGKREEKDNSNDQIKELQRGSLFLNRFSREVETNPGRTAVKCGDREIDRSTLDRYANRAARLILENYDDRYRLSKAERTRYKRQMLLHRWGVASQEKLKSTTVFVAGAGGGASPTITQLALAGFGTIKVCDFDVVELSNLNRQFLHDESRIGMNKALSAQMTIERLNPNVTVIPITERLTRENVSELVGDSAVIFDMFDGLQDKFILSECAAEKGIPHIISAMTDINGYTAIFHPPMTPCFHCLYDKKKLEDLIDGMSHSIDHYEKNPLPVVATSLFMSTAFAVNEAIKIVLGFENPAYNKFFFFNQRGTEELAGTASYRAMTYAFNDHFREISREQGFDWETGWRGKFLEELTIEPDPHCPLCSKIKGEAHEPETRQGQPFMMHTGQRAALLLYPGIPMTIGIIGALKAGKTVVPLDPTYTTARLSDILDDSEARVILTDERRMKLAEKIREKVNLNIKLIDIGSLTLDDEAGLPAFPSDRYPDQTACLLYPPEKPGMPGALNTAVIEFSDSLLNGAEYTVIPGREDIIEKGGDTLTNELIEYLREELPDYMVPSFFVELDKIPLTPNGKVDRRSLPEPRLSRDTGHKSARNKLEEKLVEIWADTLGIEKDVIGIDSNFFSLGGHSLNATLMIARIHKELNVKFPTAEIFKTPTIMGLSGIISGLTEEKFEVIEPVEKREYYEVSSAQKRFYVLKQLKGEATTSDSIPNVVSVKGKLDRTHFEETVRKLMDRHEILRTSFHLIDEKVVQRVHALHSILENGQFRIDYLETEEEKVPAIIAQFIRPFNLSEAPLFRFGIIKLRDAEDIHLLMLDMHHIITDGTSIGIFLRDFNYLYNRVELPGLNIQYKDFAAWQNANLQINNILEQEKYWLDVFHPKEKIPVLNMPTDFPRPEVQVYEGKTILFELDSELSREIKSMTAQNEVTLFMFFLAVYSILLSKYSGQEDIVIGVPIQGRRHADLENMIGFFVNTLAMRNYPQRKKTFSGFLREVRENALNAYENQDYQFEVLVDKLGIAPDPSRQPLFSAMLQHGNMGVPALKGENGDAVPPPRIHDLVIEPYEFENTIIQFDLLLHILDLDEIIGFELLYSTRLFKVETIEDGFTRHLINIIREVASNPDIKLSEIEMFSHRELESVLESKQEQLDNLEADFDL